MAPIHLCCTTVLTHPRGMQITPFGHPLQSATTLMPHSGIRHQHTKHAPTNIGRETLVNPRDIWVLGYSPIIISTISNYLSQYPNRVSARYLEDGLKHGFKLQYSGPRISVFSKNLSSASDSEEVLLEKIHSEVTAGRMSGKWASSISLVKPSQVATHLIGDFTMLCPGCPLPIITSELRTLSVKTCSHGYNF